MTRNEHLHAEDDTDPFWHLDEQLTELSLKERASGPDLYAARLKARTASGPYQAKQELYPLQHDGTEHEVDGKAYILVPDITVTVGLFDHPVPSGALGTVRGSEWEGMRHHDIAFVRGLYYQEDRALAIWEVDASDTLDEFAHATLWQSFEDWLTGRFPGALRIFTDDDEPGEDTERNREFLRALGYEHVDGTRLILGKEVRRP